MHTLNQSVDIPGDDVDVTDLLTVFTDLTVNLAQADAGVMVLIDEDGFLRLMAVASRTPRLLELFELQYEDCPCQDACATGDVVVHGDLATAFARWPKYAPEMVSAGFRSVAALPLQFHERTIGALILFRNSVGEMDEASVMIGQKLADVASVAIMQDAKLKDSLTTAGQLQHALDSRVVIEQAKGMISERAKVDMNEAFARLRGFARSHQLRLNDVALQVTTSGPLLNEVADQPSRNSLPISHHR